MLLRGWKTLQYWIKINTYLKRNKLFNFDLKGERHILQQNLKRIYYAKEDIFIEQNGYVYRQLKIWKSNDHNHFWRKLYKN